MKQIRTIKPFALVKIVWIDSMEHSGWHYPHPGDKPIELESLATIGFMIQNSPESITLSSTANELGHHLSTITIPWGCIKWAKVLKGGLKHGVKNSEEASEGAARN